MIGSTKRGLILQERDRHLLRELSVMRIIDREQAKIVAGFQSTTRVNVRLLALKKQGLLKRFFIASPAGGKRALYFLSPLGAKVAQVPARNPRRRNDEVVTVDFFVYHQLGVNQIYCTVKYEPVPVDGGRLVHWVSFDRPVDPQSSIIPDGYLEVSTPLKPLAAFLEVDLGHENLTVWKAKVEKYLRYALSGDFESSFQQPRFRVLVVTNSERRLESLRRAVAGITDKIFWFTTMDLIQKQGFWSPIWLRPNSAQEPISLL